VSQRSFVLFAVLLIAADLLGQARVIRVGLLRDKTVQKAVVMTHRGVYDVFTDGERKAQVTSHDGLKVEVGNGRLICRTLSSTYTAKERIEFRSRQANSAFRMRSMDHRMAERAYEGGLEVTLENGALRLVNVVPLEEYVAGVVQSEAGRHHHLEYYKLQAVSCRTYALSNQRKHLDQGFEVCDRVHCQVYHGRNHTDTIAQAVLETRNMVMVDADIRLIHATFHSNCGGETLNAEDVWSKSEPYLQATTDTFCLAGSHATWQKRVPRKDWVAYLKRAYGVNTASSADLFPLLDHHPTCRGIYMNQREPLVPLKQVRADWKLNSTYFTLHEEGENVVFEGRGFGHGVGVCQEGAMEMARRGFSFVDILHYYYAEVHLVDLASLDFFRDIGQ